MQALIAILLSASLLLAGSAYQPSEADSAAAGRLIQLFQVLTGQLSTTEKIAKTTESTTLRSAPNALAKSQGQLTAGTEVTVIRSETVLNSRWCYVQAGAQSGWVRETSLSLAGYPNALPANVATVKGSANVYSSYNERTKVLAQLESGAELSIRRTAQFGGTDWVYATVNSSGISGWLLRDELNMPSVVTDTDLDRSDVTQSYYPTYAQLGYVTTSQLNIRTAPGTNFDKIGTYNGGERVAVLETNSGWGRTTDGWIYMD